MSDEIKIEKGVPIPNKNGNLNGFSDTVRKCEVGDSFLWDKKDSKTNFHALSKAAGFKVTTRRHNGTVYRIWRVA